MIKLMDGCIYSTEDTKENQDTEIRNYLSLYYKTTELGECPIWDTPGCRSTCRYRLSTTADHKDGIISICSFTKKRAENESLRIHEKPFTDI